MEKQSKVSRSKPEFADWLPFISLMVILLLFIFYDSTVSSWFE